MNTTTTKTTTNVVMALVEDIRITAAASGLTLHRYQTDGGSFQTTITYALHSGATRPRGGRQCDGASVSLNQREGTTTRCQAYRELTALRATLA